MPNDAAAPPRSVVASVSPLASLLTRASAAAAAAAPASATAPRATDFSLRGRRRREAEVKKRPPRAAVRERARKETRASTRERTQPHSARTPGTPH
jgi:hypothetical protein